MDYTLRQIELYYRMAIRHENHAQAAAITATNLGFAGGKEARKALDALLKR
jgi:hypothetical protein